MAKTNLYQVYDREAETTLGPIFPVNKDGAAIRQFNELLTDEKGAPGQHPKDFDLLCLGTHESETGVITPLDKPRIVTSGADWLHARQTLERGASGSQQAAPLRTPDIHPAQEH